MMDKPVTMFPNPSFLPTLIPSYAYTYDKMVLADTLAVGQPIIWAHLGSKCHENVFKNFLTSPL